jgi:hypothetical protein
MKNQLNGEAAHNVCQHLASAFVFHNFFLSFFFLLPIHDFLEKLEAGSNSPQRKSGLSRGSCGGGKFQ